VEKWKNNFRVIDITLTLRVALVFPPTTVFGFYFPNTVPWKNGKLLSGQSYFFPRVSFIRGRVFFRQQQYSGFIFFRITENGRIPRWIFTPPRTWCDKAPLRRMIFTYSSLTLLRHYLGRKNNLKSSPGKTVVQVKKCVLLLHPEND
jgi:hypothetical protein